MLVMLKTPQPELDAHRNPPFLARAQQRARTGIDFGDVRFVIDDAPGNFHPGVRKEGQLLNTDDQFGGDAMFLEKACRCCRALQAQSLLKIKSGRQHNRVADLIFRDVLGGVGFERSTGVLRLPFHRLRQSLFGAGNIRG